MKQTSNDKVEIAPGRSAAVPGAKARKLPRYYMNRMVLLGMNDRGQKIYTPQQFEQPCWIRATEAARTLGIPFSVDTIRRLGLYGAVKIARPTPSSLMVEAGSLFAWVDKMAAEPWYWCRESNKQRWREATAGFARAWAAWEASQEEKEANP